MTSTAEPLLAGDFLYCNIKQGLKLELHATMQTKIRLGFITSPVIVNQYVSQLSSSYPTLPPPLHSSHVERPRRQQRFQPTWCRPHIPLCRGLMYLILRTRGDKEFYVIRVIQSLVSRLRGFVWPPPARVDARSSCNRRAGGLDCSRLGPALLPSDHPAKHCDTGRATAAGDVIEILVL
jgi:hypothetical protein